MNSDGRVRIAQLRRHVDVAIADGVEARCDVFLAFGGGDESEERVGHAARGRQDDGQARRRVGFENRGDARHAGGIRHAGAAELMNFPRVRHSESGIRVGACTRP